MRLKLALLVAIGALAAVAPACALAGAYKVDVCTQFAPGDGLTFSEAPNSVGFESENSCGTPGRFGGVLNLHADSQTNMRGAGLWTLRAPDETAIRSLEATRLAIPSWAPRTLVWEVRNGRGAELEGVASPAAETSVKYVVNSTSMTIGMRCTRNICQTGDSPPGVSLSGIVATMEENRPPAAAVLATPELEGPVKGVVSIPYSASDVGSGVRLSALIVDGQLNATAEDANGGRCVEPFRFLAPCKAAISSSFALDTGILKDGPHLVHVLAIDASGLETSSTDLSLTVDNTAPKVDPPNPPTPPVVPTPIPPTPPAVPTLVPPTKLPPALSGVSLSRKRVAPGKSKTELRFSSSEPGTLTIAISPLAGSAARAGAAKPVATVTRAVPAGPGSLPIVPKAKGKALPPGTYRLVVTLRAADGRASAPATLRFKVLPG